MSTVHSATVNRKQIVIIKEITCVEEEEERGTECLFKK